MKDLTGQKFNRLTAIKFVSKNRHKHNVWLFQCECGNQKEIDAASVISGHTKSCGCYGREVWASGNCRRQHGMCGTKIYQIWKGIHCRCNTNNFNDKNYKWYKNISYCQEWEKFEPFYEWAIKNGYREGLTIDRIDNLKGYSPDNCRWATQIQQANNKRNNRLVSYKGKTQSVRRWMIELGFEPSSFYKWKNKGLSDLEIIKHFEQKAVNL